MEHLSRRHPERLSGVDFAVADVPGVCAPGAGAEDEDTWEHDWVPLARSWSATETRPARVVVYRRPVEGRAEGRHETGELVLEVLVEELAELLGLDPEDLDDADGR